MNTKLYMKLYMNTCTKLYINACTKLYITACMKLYIKLLPRSELATQ